MLVTLAPAGTSGGRDRATVPHEPPPRTVPELRRARVDPLTTVVAALGECSNTLPMGARWRLARIISTESAEHGYDPLFITALMQVESGCLATARGNGALGLVQLLPSTARAVARRLGLPWQGERTLTDPSSNIQIGLHYLRELEDMLGDPYRAVAAYNLGPARVLRMSSGRAKQTQYVRKILSLYERLVEQHA
jgi:soluble lytic murein transglycosylase-like protein